MTFIAYMATLRLSNPRLNDSAKLTLTVEQFESQLKRAFDAGYEHRNSLGQKTAGDKLKEKIAEVMGMR